MHKVLLPLAFILTLIATIGIFHDVTISQTYIPAEKTIYVELDDYASDVLSLTNDYRKESGKSILLIDSKLTTAAQNKASDMCQNNYFAHNLPNGKAWHVFIDASGFKYSKAGENLGRMYSAEGVVSAWINSPLHKANLDAAYTHIGIGYSACNGKQYAVQEFATAAPLGR